ncbi:MAG: glycosyltransferase [Spirochaetota bacterium]
MKGFNPLVSIVMPVYNGSDYMREAIDSAINQTYKNIEIIVVNDGSKDNTEEIALSYGNKIRYIKKENGGTSTALNVGIKNMKGDYFSWLSHDDMYTPDKIKRQVDELSKLNNKNTVIRASLSVINEKYETIYCTNFIEHQQAYPSRGRSKYYPVIFSQVQGCELLIPKVAFHVVGLFDEKVLVAQDYEFFYRLFLEFPQQLIPERLVIARQRSQGQGQIKAQLRIEEYSKLFISILERLTVEDIKLLAPSKLEFYRELAEILSNSGHNIAVDYIHNKTLLNLQICFKDLVGNKFNGYDMHHYLRAKDIDSKMLVQNKFSNDDTVLEYNFDDHNSTRNLLRNKLFLNSVIVHLHLIHSIIHNNSFDLNYLPIITKLKPVIITLHDSYFLGAHCIHHFDCTKWQSHCFDCQYLDKSFVINDDDTALRFELLKQIIQNSAITALVASKWMEDKVKLSPVWKGKRIYKVPFGIDQMLFKPEKISVAKKRLGIHPDSVTFMFRAIPDMYEGLDIIINAFQKLKTNTKCTIITVEGTGFLNGLKDKYNIIESGCLNNDNKLVELYQACDLFLMPSKQETFGMMAIEAMSCGKMILSLATTGSALPEVINAPDCGIAVDESEYSSELQRLIDNPEEIEERGRKSLEFAKKNYDKDIYLDRIIEIYKEVIANHKIDESVKLIIQQLLKHSNRGAFPKDSRFAALFHKLIRYRLFKYIWPKIRPLVLVYYVFINKLRNSLKTCSRRDSSLF